MIWRAVIVMLALGGGSAVAQDASSSAEIGSWIAPLGLGSSDAELEQIVRTAYQAAIDFAKTNKNYFARDGVTQPLHDAMASAVAGFSDVSVPDAPSVSLASARDCVGRSGTELRFVVNVFGDGLSLAAVNATRDFAYDFDPREMADVLVYPAGACLASN